MSRLIRSILRGALSGAVGTLCMDLLWYRRFRAGGGSQPFTPWETSEGLAGYENAPAPARTAKVMAGMAGIDLPDSSARAANNAVHWVTGVAWGKMHGASAQVLGTSNPVLGLVTAVTAWATSYVVLPKLGVYKPMSEYDRDVLKQDLTAHLVFGAGLGLTYRLLSPRR
ncbi:MAG: hypothetical protein WCE80_03570 [Acidimicrobiia bacterium]